MRQRKIVAVSVVALAVPLSLSPAIAQSVPAYDEAWHRGSFWSGEYPGGFTVLKDVTVQLRPALDPQAEKSIACDLPAKATYQAWNAKRVTEQGLAFVSFTEIDEMKVTTDYEAVLYREDDYSEVSVAFAPGDQWRYLAYFAEGTFLMEHEGVRYSGDQSLVDVSEAVRPGERGYDEWLRINCPNNQWGWLFMGDVVVDDVTFASPNITEYGASADLD